MDFKKRVTHVLRVVDSGKKLSLALSQSETSSLLCNTSIHAMYTTTATK